MFLKFLYNLSVLCVRNDLSDTNFYKYFYLKFYLRFQRAFGHILTPNQTNTSIKQEVFIKKPRKIVHSNLFRIRILPNTELLLRIRQKMSKMCLIHNTLPNLQNQDVGKVVRYLPTDTYRTYLLIAANSYTNIRTRLCRFCLVGLSNTAIT